MIALFCAVLCSCETIYAQNVKGTAIVDCPREVVADKTFKYSVEIQSDSTIKVVQLLPPFATIEVIFGPQISISTSTTLKDGKIINKYSQKYTYVFACKCRNT